MFRITRVVYLISMSLTNYKIDGLDCKHSQDSVNIN